MSNDSSKLKNPGWNPITALIVVLGTFLVIPTVVQIALMFVPNVLGWDSAQRELWANGAPLANFLFVLFTEVLTVGAVYQFVQYKGISYKIALGLGKPKWRDAGHALLGIMVYFGIFTILFGIITAIFQIDTDQRQALGFEQGVGGLGLVLAFVGLVILPPIAEEIVFRGFFFGSLRRNGLRVWPSILITSLLFASLHLFGAASGGLLWAAFVDVFSLSIVLCYLREQNGTIWASIGVHALKNGFVFLNLFIIQGS
ncbi:MAG TPA: type II CAAX endopeptidase family protein [Candidatus Saccharimonadales bacterium]|nr:type II CAAX endopeptidase family protein [Candidatus Saccharimonadales bacterium]